MAKVDQGLSVGLVAHRRYCSRLGAVVIEGAKACGKTATARQLAASEVLLDVDVDAGTAAAVDPRLILGGRTPRLIDQWQREPRVWDTVRRAVDDRARPGQFILTGSATPNDTVVRHSGAGGISVMRMRPMTLPEQGFSTGEVSVASLMSGRAPAAARSTLDLAGYADRIVIGGGRNCSALTRQPRRSSCATTSRASSSTIFTWSPVPGATRSWGGDSCTRTHS